MSDSERQEKEELLQTLKLVHQTHNELADRGIILYGGMSEDEYLTYRLEIMAQIAALEKELNPKNE
jgi:hypothetical protein